jgi:hypothetical protein
VSSWGECAHDAPGSVRLGSQKRNRNTFTQPSLWERELL